MAERSVHGVLFGIVLFWLGASVTVRGDGVPDWWLPVALAGGITISWLSGQPAVTTTMQAPMWARVALWLTIAVAVTAVGYGVIATPSRHWDGAACFDAKVFWLTETPTLSQPFFSGRGVFHHSPDYPLLQPLLIAMLERIAPGCGRLVLPGLYLLACGVIATALRRRGIHALLTTTTVLAIALTPSLLAPGGGAVDSGYGELLLLVATTTIASGFLNGSRVLVGVGVALAITSKPEGMLYALLACVAAFGDGRRGLLVGALLGLLVALASWLPVQAQLLRQNASAESDLSATAAATLQLMLLVAGLLALAAFAWTIELLSRRRQRPRLFRWAWALGPLLLMFGCLPLIDQWLPAVPSAFAVYLAKTDHLWQNLTNLPAYCAAVFEFGIARLRIGMALVLPMATALVAWRRRVALTDTDLMAWVLLSLASTVTPFLLSPEPDLQHHLRSSLPRLLLHWVGPLWLLTACWLDRVLPPPSPSVIVPWHSMS